MMPHVVVVVKVLTCSLIHICSECPHLIAGSKSGCSDARHNVQYVWWQTVSDVII